MAVFRLSDKSLACRLERAEAIAGRRFVEARARVSPETGASWIEVAGASAIFDGPDSPCTQTFGLGMFGLPAPAEMDRIEAFFRDRSAPVFHEVCPLADKGLLAVLGNRGYRPVEWSNVMCLPLAERPVEPPPVHAPLVRVAGAGELELWARAAVAGWSEFPEFAPFLQSLMRVAAEDRGNVPFLAEIDGQPAAAGGLRIHEGVALLAGASTIPEWRRRGAQLALLRARLDYAAAAGCEVAMIAAEPGSASARNAERRGFRAAYTRTKWRLEAQPEATT